MRIAYLSADRGIPVFGTKGASIHILEMVNAFGRLGHEVTVFAPVRGVALAPLSADVIEVGAKLLLNMERMPGVGIEARAGLKERRSMDISALITAEVLRRHERLPYDLIYERYSLFSTAGIEAAAALGVPCVVEVNAPLLDEQRIFRRLVHEQEARHVARRVFGESTVVIAVSEEVKRHVLSEGGGSDRTHVVPNGVDRKRFHPNVVRTPLCELDGRFVVGFTGSLKPWHGLNLLMHAFRSLHARDPECHLLVVGEGPLRSWIDGFASGAGITDRVTVTGWVPKEQLPGFLSAMDVAVAPYPALENFYFSPLKLFEYMAVGRPIVASRIGQVAAILNDDVDARLVEAGDPDALADAIDALRKNRDLREQLGRRAATSPYLKTWEDNARTILGLVETDTGPWRATG